ncbi:carboxypeptidase-like regulatory domain-containing protein [Kiritimatiellota bacterium B12222]|nr:carboxypeptidase-like regulatory domain-containing protein [Kiritimatiellota bacterium B12222]
MRPLWKLLLCLCVTSQVACQPLKTVNVNVVGDDGNPIEGAEVVVWFYGYQPEDSKSDEGLTDEEGKFQAQGRPKLGMLVRINKKGYYQTEKDRLPMTEEQDQRLTLRKKIKPIPLYAKRYFGTLPSIGPAYGFDFQVGDWVHPDGKGKNPDIFFRAIELQNENGEWGGRLEVSFNQEEEGVLFIEEGFYPLSKMVMPHFAPKKGYKYEYVREEFGYQNENKEKDGSFFFRTRKKTLPDGKVIFCHTKFYNGLSFLMGGGKFVEEKNREISPVEMARIEFTYAFNPTPGDRNLEFNTSQNLMSGLDSAEKVRQP